ncbi:MAG: TATA-box-binding protein [Euryarchaeota archaeon]|nr:TATA-box-binding protein [Euryarchaeota archaeon]
MPADPTPSLRVENVVASSNLGQTIDLVALASQVEEAEYNKERFPGVVYRIRDPKIAVLIFGSGKVVCTGAKSLEDIHSGIRKVFETLRRLRIEVPGIPEITIQNIVASGHLSTTALDLDRVASALGVENVEYEPEMFPGLVYRLKVPKIVSLIFGSGKVVLTGGKNLEDVRTALVKIQEELEAASLL